MLDRLTGQFISAGPFSQVTWAKGIDQKTGRPIVNPEALLRHRADHDLARRRRRAQLVADVVQSRRPASIYIPTSTDNSCTYAAEPNFDPQPGRMTGTVAADAAADHAPPPPAIGPEPIEGPGGRGALVAWDPVAQQMRWRSPAAAASAAAR